MALAGGGGVRSGCLGIMEGKAGAAPLSLGGTYSQGLAGGGIQQAEIGVAGCMAKPMSKGAEIVRWLILKSKHILFRQSIECRC